MIGNFSLIYILIDMFEFSGIIPVLGVLLFYFFVMFDIFLIISYPNLWPLIVLFYIMMILNIGW